MDPKLLSMQEEPSNQRKKDKKSKKEKKPKPAAEAEAEEAAAEQEEPSNKRKKDKKSKKDKKRKLAAEAEEAAAEEEAKSSKKRGVATEEPDQGGAVEKSVAVTGKGFADPKYAPLKSFAAAALPTQVLDCCKGFDRPSPIQALAWPYLLDGRDFIGIAATGSGKTIAFGVPALMHVRKKLSEKGAKKGLPRCLMLAPTRELAQQIADVLTEAGAPCGINSVCLYGGTSKGPQISSLKSGVEIVIGTPGRMKDLIEMGVCRLNEVSFVVLDEADRMLDMGFEPEVRAILSQTSSVLDDRARDSRLVALLDKYHRAQSNRVLVFVLYKKEAGRVEAMLNKRGWKAVSVHGDKAQHDRTKALSLFKEGKCPLMIATDVASRGLDIPDVEVVINYSFPLTTEDYVHRIGRTGRAGKKGVAHTFFTQADKGLAGELVNVLREADQVVPPALTKFGTHVKKKESKIYGSHFKEITADAPKSTKITFGDSDEE
uniref:RNA helicase n=1 Tax=Aegilops tauschii TaxID=37682 RepID=M8BXR9_AEGTA